MKKIFFYSINIILPGLAFAAAPVAFDQWQADGGIINSQCPDGFSCDVLVSENGILQRGIIDLSDDRYYIQTFIADKNVSGAASTLPYANEHYVRMSEFNSPLDESLGLASKQSVNFADASNNEAFVSVSEIFSGWAAPEGMSRAFNFSQSAQEINAIYGVAFDNKFDYEKNVDLAGSTMGYSLDILQTIGMHNVATWTIGQGDDKSANKLCSDRICSALDGPSVQHFVQQERGGNLSPAGENTLPNKGKTVYRDAGDNVKVVWIANALDTGPDPRDAKKKLNGGLFGFWSYQDNNEEDSGYDTDLLILWPDSPYGGLPDVPSTLIDTSLGQGTGYEAKLGETPDFTLADPFDPYLNNAPPFLPDTQQSGAPVEVNNWSVSNGTISSNCPSNFNCMAEVSYPGFLQESLTDKLTGQSYIRVILTEEDASGNPTSLGFSMEDYVNISGEQDGYAGVQRLDHNGGPEVGSIAIATAINSGWAKKPDNHSVDIFQRLSDTESVKSHSYTEHMHFVRDNDINGVMIGQKVDLVQTASSQSEKLGLQVFMSRQVAGDMLTEAGFAEVPALGGENGLDTVTWQAGDNVAATMVIQNIDGGSLGRQTDPTSFNNAEDWNQGWGGAKVSALGYVNRTGGIIDEASIVTPSGPIFQLWQDDPFGPLPDEMTQLLSP